MPRLKGDPRVGCGLFRSLLFLLPPSASLSQCMAVADIYVPTPVCSPRHSRNVSCIQCASPRPLNIPHHIGASLAQATCSNSMPSANTGPLSLPTPRNTSPRFASPMSMQSRTQNFAQQQQQELLLKAQLQAQAHPQTHPLLTPSGRAFAVGGTVQNISSDPLAPCVMFWPDNEPLPEPGQIRPASLSTSHVRPFRSEDFVP